MSDEEQWWYPTLINAEYQRLRDDYDDKADWSGAELAKYFNEDVQKYATTWDHIGDAYNEYVALADAYLALRERVKELEREYARLLRTTHCIVCQRKAVSTIGKSS